MRKIKELLGYLFGVALLVFATLLYRKTKEKEALESELVREKTNADIKLNEQARQAARDHANNLVDEYENFRRGAD